jgi:hypothetical protein
MGTTRVDDIESADPTRTANGKRVRRVHVAALAAAVVVCAVSAVFAVQTTMDRGEAARARRTAAHELQAQRIETRSAERTLAASRADARADEMGITGMLASAQGLVTLADQGLDAARATQAAGANDPVATADEYNAAAARSNAITDQYNATLDILDQQIAELGKGGGTPA